MGLGCDGKVESCYQDPITQLPLPEENILKLKQLGNWFSDREPEKNEPNDQPAPPMEAALAKYQSKIDKLNEDLQAVNKELAQTKAQLQINQGFQIELGETQLQLQQLKVELQRYKKEVFEKQKRLTTLESESQSTQEALAKITAEQDWLKQLKVPVRVTDIKRTIPKGDFETLWGFGILSPTVDTIITTGAILVRGWVLGKKAEAETVKVMSQGEILLETKVDHRRPAIAHQYPDISQAGKSGFEFSLAVTGISETIELSLEAILKDETTIALCKFLLTPEIESKDT